MIGTKNEVMRWLLDSPEGQYEVNPWHPKRSLSANSYYWVLLSELAGVLTSSKHEIHYELIRRHSPPYRKKDGGVVALVSRQDPEDLPGYWMLREERKDGRKGYIRLKGSSDMDSKEFSRLLDGLIEECKEVGIETLPPERLRGYERKE